MSGPDLGRLLGHAGHARRVYRCGHVESQCRCPGPKPTVALGRDCDACHAARGGPTVELGRADVERDG